MHKIIKRRKLKQIIIGYVSPKKLPYMAENFKGISQIKVKI